MKIAGVGSFVPVTGTRNPELEARLGLEPGWIEQRTGVEFRPTAAAEQAVSDLAIRAASDALQAAQVDPSQVGLVLLATSTPDHLLPPTAPLVAHRLGLARAGAIDLTGACSGFLYGLVMGAAVGQIMQCAVLVIGANILTRRVDPLDTNTAVLFADGAGAVVLTPSSTAQILGFHLGADGSRYDSILIPGGGSREPLTAESLAAKRNTIAMKSGGGVFKQAVQMMAEAGKRALLASKLTSPDVDLWIPHQANLRIVREAGRLLDIGEERTVTTLRECGNSSAAAIPSALAQAVADRLITPGQTLLMTAVGAGMMSAGVVVKW
jgi:3-oxoacyl-[acyl-carrier-protein] synthase-3